MAERDKLSVIQTYEESASAYKLGRPLFNEMIQRIHDGEADGILVWAYNRLARNAMDGGMIIHLLDESKLKEIRTPSGRTDGSGNNKFMLQLEFAMSKKTSDDNSESVKRGNREKILRGWDIHSRTGYMFVEDEHTAEKIIVPDPERFPLIRRCFELVLEYVPVSEAHRQLNEEWAFRTPKTRKLGGKPLSLSGLYRILKDDFYCGWIYTKQGEQVHGKHQPMVTEAEFRKVQEILDDKHKGRGKTVDLPYRGVIKCGECGCTICGEEKYQTICTVCKTKFASKNHAHCPRCQIPIVEMDNPVHLHYRYARCSKKKPVANCKQKYSSLDDIDGQIVDKILSLEISPRVHEWVLQQLQKHTAVQVSTKKQALRNLHKERENIQAQKHSLLQNYTSPSNKNKDLITEEEYRTLKQEYQDQENRIQELLADFTQQEHNMIKDVEDTFEFAMTAYQAFKRGDSHTKTNILRELGSNPTLFDGILRIDHSELQMFIKRNNEQMAVLKSRGLEPEKQIDEYEKTGVVNETISLLQAH